MIEKIKDINPSIPGMLIVQLLYLIVGEALIICIAIGHVYYFSFKVKTIKENVQGG